MATVEEMKQVPLPKRTMVLARANGQLYQIDFTDRPQMDDPALIDWELSVSKLLIGKFQLTRSRFVTVDEIELENIERTGQFPAPGIPDFGVTVYSSIDGKNVTETVFPSVAKDEEGYVRLTTRLTGKNFSVMLRGTYNINTVIFTTHNHGRR